MTDEPQSGVAKSIVDYLHTHPEATIEEIEKNVRNAKGNPPSRGTVVKWREWWSSQPGDDDEGKGVAPEGAANLEKDLPNPAAKPDPKPTETARREARVIRIQIGR